MARFVVGARQASAATSTNPGGSLYSNGTVSLKLVEIGVSNTTATQCMIALCRITTAGTQGAALTEAEYDESAPAPTGAGFNTHTSTGPTISDLGYRATVGAAYGAGVIWTFGDRGLIVPAASNNGIGIYVPNGTGQICDFYFVWDE